MPIETVLTVQTFLAQPKINGTTEELACAFCAFAVEEVREASFVLMPLVPHCPNSNGDFEKDQAGK